MKAVKRLLPESPFAKNVITLMMGTGVAQAIPIAISPILTRIYTPEDFGVFALYMALSSIIAVIGTGRYELAIMLPLKDSEAANITALSICLAGVVSVIICLIVVIFNGRITALLGSPDISGWLYFIPASIFLIGSYQSLSYWNNRKREYKRVAVIRVLQSFSISLVQLGSGMARMGSAGLVGGQIIGQGCAVAGLAYTSLKKDREFINQINKKTCLDLAKEHIKFPKYMIFGQLANEASGQMPVLLLGTFFGPAIAGFYLLSQRTLTAPMSLVGSAIGDVFRQEAALVYNESGNCRDIYLKTVAKLLVLASMPVLPVLLFGPWLFSFVFGEQWREAGEIASIISIMVFFQTISSPLSQTVLLAGMQLTDLVWQLFRFCLSVIAFYVGYVFFDSYEAAIVLYVLFFSILYLLHSVMQYKAASGMR